MTHLTNKIAVVTGGSKGIGKQIALALGRQGCRVAITARHDAELDRAADELRSADIQVLPVKADVRHPKEVAHLVSAVKGQFGAAHILVNNAGIGLFSEVATMPDDDFRAVLETNLFGVFHCTKAFLPGMIENQEGFIVNISSLAGKNSFAGGSAYCASKHALMSFAECLMLEVRHHNIKVSTICPGSVQTDFNAESRAKSWALSGEDVAKTVVDLLTSSGPALVSLVEMRPLRPPKK